MRQFLEIVVPLLLPAFLFWLYASYRQKRGNPVKDVPWSWLAVLGALLCLVVLAGSWLAGNEPPGKKYVPPALVNGVVVPGHVEGEAAP
jgi:hypothetical protein